MGRLFIMDKKDVLTKKQKLLVKELDNIFLLLRLDYQNIKRYENEWRTPALNYIKNKVIRGAVIMEYVLIDEFLNDCICKYFFPKEKGFIHLWKTKKFQYFNYYILEEIYLMQKLRFVNAILKIPKSIRQNIGRINILRNGLAHSFFPENLKKSKPEYKGKNIFTFEGLKLFMDDVGEIGDFFGRKLYIERWSYKK